MVKKLSQKNTKVTYIIPHLPKTRVDMLCEAIKSAENQTYNNIEILVVGKKQRGYLNIIDGLKIATGELIHILHDDDFLTPESAQIAVDSISDSDFLHGNIIRHYENGRQVLIKPEITKPTINQLLNKNVIQVASVYYLKKALESIGGWSDKGNELFTHLDLLSTGKKITYVDKPLSYYRKHKGQYGQSEDYKVNGNINKEKYLKQYVCK